jgi:hypothetical protein
MQLLFCVMFLLLGRNAILFQYTCLNRKKIVKYVHNLGWILELTVEKAVNR